MQKIQMVDLAAQLAGIRPEVDQALQRVLDATAFVNGPEVHALARALESYLRVAHVVPCGNGTDALQVAMMAGRLQPGDEVITPTFTYISTVEVVALLGLRPVLVDVDPDSFTVDVEAVSEAITPRTKAIVPVHLFGQCANMEPLLQLANEENLLLIEDAAQAIGAKYQFSNQASYPAGSMGSMAGLSFYPSKNLGAYGDGGAVMTQDDELAAALRSITNHGQAERYTFQQVGVNSRLDTMQAAILQVKLQYLDTYSARRQQAARYYDHALADVPHLELPKRMPYSTHVYHQYTLKVRDGLRDGLKAHLHEHGIPSVVFYPRPAHLQPAYEQLGYRAGDFPVSEQLSAEVLSLPMHSELSEEQLRYITTTLRRYLTS